jgi:hypothetical protein
VVRASLAIPDSTVLASTGIECELQLTVSSQRAIRASLLVVEVSRFYA